MKTFIGIAFIIGLVSAGVLEDTKSAPSRVSSEAAKIPDQRPCTEGSSLLKGVIPCNNITSKVESTISTVGSTLSKVPSFFMNIFSPRISSFPSLDFPNLPEKNSTYEIKEVNGTKIEINSTVSEGHDDRGVYYSEVQIIRVRPSSGNENVTVSKDGKGTNEGDRTSTTTEVYEDFGRKK